MLSTTLPARSQVVARAAQTRAGRSLAPAARPSIAARAATENESTAVSGEWPVTWSLASYEDVGAFFQKNVFQVRGRSVQKASGGAEACEWVVRPRVLGVVHPLRVR